MAGLKGRSGRRPKPLEVHLMAGTYRPDRHGPLSSAPARPPAPLEPPAPLLEGLGGPGAALVRAVLAEFECSVVEQAVLRVAAESADRLAQVRAVIAAEGIQIPTARGAQPHPLLRVEKATAATLLTALRQLGVGDREVR